MDQLLNDFQLLRREKVILGVENFALCVFLLLLLLFFLASIVMVFFVSPKGSCIAIRFSTPGSQACKWLRASMGQLMSVEMILSFKRLTASGAVISPLFTMGQSVFGKGRSIAKLF